MPNLKRFEGLSLFSGWLKRIVINAALMKRRSSKAPPRFRFTIRRTKTNCPSPSASKTRRIRTAKRENCRRTHREYSTD